MRVTWDIFSEMREMDRRKEVKQKQTELKLEEVASFMKSVDIMKISLAKLYVRIAWTFEQREEKMETAYN